MRARVRVNPTELWSFSAPLNEYRVLEDARKFSGAKRPIRLDQCRRPHRHERAQVAIGVLALNCPILRLQLCNRKN
jgi:hypothetical protein